MATFSGVAEVLSQEEAVEVKALARQGWGVREIARELGVSRNTVRQYLRGAEAGYRERAARPCKLDPYQDYVRERLAAAAPDVIPATVLLREIQARGYSGGISQLKAFIAPLRPREKGSECTFRKRRTNGGRLS